MQGKLIGIVSEGIQEAGDLVLTFNPSKLSAAAGVYLLKLSVGEKVGWVKAVGN